MDATGGFNAANKSETIPPRCSNCSGNLVYWLEKEGRAELSLAEFEVFLLVAPQPKEIWTSRDYGWI
jgi:hypothetical protein